MENRGVTNNVEQYKPANCFSQHGSELSSLPLKHNTKTTNVSRSSLDHDPKSLLEKFLLKFFVL